MKKLSLVLLSMIIVMSFSFSACASSNQKLVANNNAVSNTTKVAANATAVSNAKANATTKGTTNTKTKVDIDLVKLKGNMLYSQITNIVDDYEKYLGKTIRFIGKMGIVDGENKYYYTVSAGDATACCNTPLEFVLKGGSTDKKDYPEAGRTVRITGKLETYQEGKQTYLHLVDSELYVYKK